MAEEYIAYPVRIKVVSQKGYCAMGHKVGDEWVYTFEPFHPKTPDICPSVLHDLMPYFWTLWFGGTFAWPTPERDTCHEACPDPDNPVIFELKRLRDEASHMRWPQQRRLKME